MVDYIGRICPYCKEPIRQGDAVRVCSSCGTVHHEACWNANGGCTTPGCPEQNSAVQYGAPAVVCAQCGMSYGGDQSFCPGCGTPNPSYNNPIPVAAQNYPVPVANAGGANVCSNCGTVLMQGQTFCPSCGMQNNANSAITQYNADTQKNSNKKKILIPIIAGSAVLVIAVIIVLIIVFQGPAVEQISLSKSSVEVKVDETATISYTITPQEAADTNVDWTSSDNSVATVSSSGVITGVSEGTCTITATAGGKSGTVSVTVKNGPDFKAVHSAIGGDSYYCTLATDGSYLAIDTNPLDLDDFSSSTAWQMVKDANTELGLPASVTTKMSTTRYLDGKQSETHNGVTVSWTYHPDQGLEVMYEAE